MRVRLYVVALAVLATATVARAQCFVVGDTWNPNPIKRTRSDLPAGSSDIKVKITSVKVDTHAPDASNLIFPENLKVRLDEAVTLTTRCDDPSRAYSDGFPLGTCKEECGYNNGQVSVTCSERTKDSAWTVVFCNGGGESQNVTGVGTACVRYDHLFSPRYFSVDCSGPPQGFGRTANTRDTPVTVDVEDNNSGVGFVFLELKAPSGRTVDTYCTHNPSARPNGWICSFDFGQASEAGNYVWNRLFVKDQAGNERTYSPSNVPPGSTIHPIEVIIDDADTTAPHVSAASLTAPDVVTLNYDAAAPEWSRWSHDEVVLRFNVTDDKTGYTGASFTFRSPTVFGATYEVRANTDWVTTGSRKAGFVEYKIKSHFSYPGVWTLTGLSLWDAANNQRTYTDMGALGISRTTFTLRTPNEPEYPAPREIKSGSIAIWPSVIDVSTIDTQKVYINVTLANHIPGSIPTVSCNLKAAGSPNSFITITARHAASAPTADGGTLLTGSVELDPYGLYARDYQLVGCYASDTQEHGGITARRTWTIYGELTPDQQDQLDPKPEDTSAAAGRGVSVALLLALLAAAVAQLLA